uniref:NADH-ubiquinone oxidoreductase chain 5 n=1 Tax=Pecten albicans TaxID=106278 RepID=A0A0F6T926_9BIVA|nr:NADH dehydrogenase subunit 5 [Pecten albicans]
MMVGFYSQSFCGWMSFVCLAAAVALAGDTFSLGWEVIRLNSFGLGVDIFVDGVGLVFASIVLFIASSVFNFSGLYMGTSSHPIRFHGLLMSFVLSMIVFIFVPNLFGLMVGWDGLGIFSFLLVLFYPCHSSLSAGMITGLTNRLGDSFLMLVLLVNGLVYGGSSINGDCFGLVSFCLVIGAMTKSAQFPFCSWLPRAMAAPTPVSSLVHSSTLVTAGVFLIVRYHVSLSDSSLVMLQWASLITMALSGLNACVEFDMKKVVALSTLSQVSFMMFAVGVGFPFLAFFHLISHAVTKALLFICVGLVIMGYSQDLRRLGGSFLNVESVKWYFGGACAGLCGFPFFSGFYSKEMIIESVLYSNVGWLGFCLFSLGVLSTSYYSARLAFFCFFSGLLNSKRGGVSMFRYSGCMGEIRVHSFCLGLFILSVVLGGVGAWFFLCPPSMFPCHVSKALVMLCCPFGLWLFWLNSVNSSHCSKSSVLEGGYMMVFPKKNVISQNVGEVGDVKIREWKVLRESFVRELGFLDGFSGQPFVYAGLTLSEEVNSSLDQGWLEYFGPGGLSSCFKKFLDCNNYMSNHWFALFFIVYIFEVVIWVVTS